jgi:outer membrane protein TolC
MRGFALAAILTLARGAVGEVSAADDVLLTPALVNGYADQARTNNPAFQAAVARTHAARFGVAGVRRWEDPMLKMGGFVATDRGPNLAEEGDLIYGVEQKLPLFGKSKAARGVAEQELRSAQLESEYQFQVLRRDLAKALFRAALAERVVDIGRQDLAQVELWTGNAEQRYASGTGSQIEVLRLKNEAARRVQDLKTRENERQHEHLTINRLFNRSLDAPLPRFLLPSPAPPVPYSERLVAMAINAEPRLQVMHQEVRVADARAALMRRQRLPDLTVGIDARQYTRDAGLREGMFTLGLNLPWFNAGKYRSDVYREQERGEAARLDALDYELAVREEVHILTVRIDAARREAMAYADDIVPRSEQALQVSGAAWMSNRGMFTDMMESRRMLLEARLMQARAVAEQYQMLSELLLCCGLADLDGIEPAPSKPAPPAPAPTSPPSRNSP